MLPPLIRLREMVRLYSVDTDGVSMQTFYARTAEHQNTLLFVQDRDGWRFGAFCTGEWVVSKYFYGTGESFVFSFEDDEEEGVLA